MQPSMPICTPPNELSSVPTRRYDIEALRSVALLLLILYHVAISFQSWAHTLIFPQHASSLGGLWEALSIMHVWRIPLLFFISGMGVYFAIQYRSALALIKERTYRILLPYLFGFFVIAPLQLTMSLAYYNQPITYLPNAGHLWFLGHIYVYVMIFFPFFFWLKRHENSVFMKKIRSGLHFSPLLLLFSLPVLLGAHGLQPESYTRYFDTLHGLILGFSCFFLGFFLSALGQPFWQATIRMRWLNLLVGLTLFLRRLTIYVPKEMEAPDALNGFETMLWIFALLGFAAKHLNRPSALLYYLTSAVYPVYILHLPVQFALGLWILPNVPTPWLSFLLLLIGTYAGSFLLFELLKRVGPIRPLFGMKR